VSERFDIVVAGAGMTGATAALALASAGFRVALVDPQPFERQLAPSFDGRASAIAYSSFRMLTALGVGARLEPDACRIEQILVTDGRSPGAAARATAPFHLRFAAAEIAGRSGGEPLGYMVENRRIRAALAAQLGASSVALITPARVESVEAGPASATVRLSGGRVLETQTVIGAEGRDSGVRTGAGMGVVGWRYGQSGIVATVRHERPHGGVAHEHFLPGGPFAILPLTDDRSSLVWTEPVRRAQALAAASPDAFEAHLRRRFGEFLGEVRVEGPRFSYPLSLQLAERWTAPRIALLGDAAHAIHPIAGQGLNLGLKDAAALAEVLADAARLGEDVGAQAVLERYAAWRRFDTVALAAATDVFTRLFSNDNPLLRAVRGAGVATVNRIGPARRFFMAEAGGAVGDMPRLLRGEAV
jgi:2-octaprenyl-6-methoxyphenol hydroxylase